MRIPQTPGRRLATRQVATSPSTHSILVGCVAAVVLAGALTWSWLTGKEGFSVFFPLAPATPGNGADVSTPRDVYALGGSGVDASYDTGGSPVPQPPAPPHPSPYPAIAMDAGSPAGSPVPERSWGVASGSAGGGGALTFPAYAGRFAADSGTFSNS